MKKIQFYCIMPKKDLEEFKEIITSELGCRFDSWQDMEGIHGKPEYCVTFSKFIEQ